MANQNISLSFDPACMSCVSCAKEHSVFVGDKSACVCVSDQNFVPNISGNGNCVSVVRLESASLLELADITIEIFEKITFPAGSVICIGSASHLHKVGLTLYAQEWNSCVAILSRRIAGIQICPLIPVIRDAIPGSLANELIELTSYLVKQYEGSTLGLSGAWSHLAGTIAVLTADSPQPPAYSTVALPATLAVGAPLVTHRFCKTSSRRVTSPGYDAKAANELVSALLTALRNELGIACNPGGHLVREFSKPSSSADTIKNIVLVGASHMRRVACHLQDMGYCVVLYTLSGGMASPASIAALNQWLSELNVTPGTALVFDLFGNFTYRFEQEDGGMALPICLSGGHHMLGRIGVCSDSTFVGLVSKIAESLSTVKNSPCVVLPPIPRYISGGCCSDTNHSGGVTAVRADLLESCKHLRKVLKEELLKIKQEGVWVADVVAGIAAPSDNTGNTDKLMDSYRDIFTADNVHMTTVGYARLATTIVESVERAKTAITSGTADILITGEKRNFYWRGFASIRGGTRREKRGSYGNASRDPVMESAHGARSRNSGPHQRGRGRGGFHPYGTGRGGKPR